MHFACGQCDHKHAADLYAVPLNSNVRQCTSTSMPLPPNQGVDGTGRYTMMLLNKSCPLCHSIAGWQADLNGVPASAKVILIDRQGMKTFTACNYQCQNEQCKYTFRYNDPLAYVTRTLLPGNPKSTTTAISRGLIELYLNTRRLTPATTISAFISAGLGEVRVQSHLRSKPLLDHAVAVLRPASIRRALPHCPRPVRLLRNSAFGAACHPKVHVLVWMDAGYSAPRYCWLGFGVVRAMEASALAVTLLHGVVLCTLMFKRRATMPSREASKSFSLKISLALDP